MGKHVSLVLSLLMFCQGSPAFSADFLTFVVDQGRSRVWFEAGTRLHPFKGIARHVEGRIRADRLSNPLKVEAEVKIEAAQLDTGLRDRDEIMKKHLEWRSTP